MNNLTFTLQSTRATVSNAPIIIGSSENGKSTLSTYRWSNDAKEEQYVEKLLVALLLLLKGTPEAIVRQKLAQPVYLAEYNNLCIHECKNPARKMPKEYAVLSTPNNIYPFERIDIRFDYSVYGIKNIPYCDILEPVRMPADKSPEQELWLHVESTTRTLVINSFSPRSKELQNDEQKYISSFIDNLSYLLSNRAQYGL